MLRLALGVVVAGGLALGWPALRHHDPSFKAGMVAVSLHEAGNHPLLVSRYEVSWASWQQCFQEGGCSYLPKPAPGGAALPVTGVNWFDASEYLAWANARGGGGLRLPTIAEWRELDRSLARPKPEPAFSDPRLSWAATYGQESTPVGPVRPMGSFSTTPDGVSDLDGNVWEWTSSCYKTGLGPNAESLCPAFYAAGAHEAAVSVFVRNPALGGCATGTPPTHLGLRLVADP